MGVSGMNVYLVGSPNVGKSTIYSVVTKSRSRPWIANFAGSTRRLEHSEETYGQLIDTPGLEHLYLQQDSWVDEIRQDPHAVLLYVMDATQWLRDAVLLEQWSLLEKPLSVLVMHTDLVSYQPHAEVELMKQIGIHVQLTHYHDVLLADKFAVALRSAMPRVLNERFEGTAVTDETALAVFMKDDAMLDVALMRQWLMSAQRYWSLLKIKKQKISAWSLSVDRWLWRSTYAGWVLSLLLLSGLLALILCAQVFSEFLVETMDRLLEPCFLRITHPYVLQCLRGLLVWVALLPSIVMARAFTSVIEHSGLGQRMMVLGSRMFGALGLPTHAWIPMIMSFNCNVVAMDLIDGVEPKQRERLAYLLPMIPCSARWTVGVLLTAVLPASQSIIILSCGYLLSLSLVVLLAAWTVDVSAFKPQAIVLTPLRFPSVRELFLEVYWSSLAFLKGMLKWLLPVQLMMNLLMTLTLSGLWTFQLEDSLLSVMARKVIWLFYPMGLGVNDWPWISGLLPGLLAKEAMVSIWLPLSHVVQAEHSPEVIMSFLAWSWLYVPCLGTVKQMRRFVGYRAWIYTLGTFLLGYAIACLIAQGFGSLLVMGILLALKLSLRRPS